MEKKDKLAHKITLSRHDVDRFLSKVRVDKKSSCHMFAGYRTWEGYGRFSIGGYSEVAHRVAWTIANGQVPKGLWVLHTCDNPPCVNPKHLCLGTRQDNANDMLARGRSKGAVGEGYGNAKLMKYQVRNILRLFHTDGFPVCAIAERHSVSHSTVRRIVLGEGWKHVYKKFMLERR